MSRPMTCEEAARQFFSYLDRALTGEALTDLEQHLAACLACCDRLHFSRQLDAFVRSRTRNAPLPEGMESRLRERIAAARTKLGES